MIRSLLAGYLRRHAGRYGAGIALLLATNALALCIPWLLKHAVEAISRRGPMRLVAAYAGLIVAIAVVQGVVRTGSRLLILGVARLVCYDLRRRLFEKLLALPPSYYDRMRTGDLMSRTVNDMQLVRSLFGPGVLNLVNTTAVYAGSIAVMAYINPRLCAFSLVPYPLVLVFMNRLTRSLYRRSNEAQEQLASLSSRVQENLSGMQQVKAFDREEAENEEFREVAGEYRRRNLALARTRGAIVPLMGSIGGLGTLAVLWLGGRQVIEGRMTLGDLVAFDSYLAGLAWPTLAMGWIINVFQRGMGAMERIGEVLQAPEAWTAPVRRGEDRQAAAQEHPEPVGQAAEQDRTSLGERAPAMTFRSLEFRYDGSSRPALTSIDLSVPPGGTIGIVGPVGSGKSTLLSLVAGLYPSPPGSVLLAGRDIASMDPAELRSMVALVPQESFLFSRTIAENIALGRPDATAAEIGRAAELARLSEDLEQFPDGYDTLVGERGITLSGGQRQRVALARALLLDPAVLLLDDTLSAVDASTEAAILENLRSVRQGRTCLMATHRLSAVKDADRIAVLNGGRIVEQGRHAELITRGGLYALLYRRQLLEDELQRA